MGCEPDGAKGEGRSGWRCRAASALRLQMALGGAIFILSLSVPCGGGRTGHGGGAMSFSLSGRSCGPCIRSSWVSKVHCGSHRTSHHHGCTPAPAHVGPALRPGSAWSCFAVVQAALRREATVRGGSGLTRKSHSEERLLCTAQDKGAEGPRPPSDSQAAKEPPGWPGLERMEPHVWEAGLAWQGMRPGHCYRIGPALSSMGSSILPFVFTPAQMLSLWLS